MVEHQLTCNYTNLDRFATLNLHALEFVSTRELYHCTWRARTSARKKHCLLEAEERCKKLPLRFVKTIRLSALSVVGLMETLPCLKLVYLIRDPRGSYYSKQKMFQLHGINVTFDAERFCSRLDKDVDAIYQLKDKYPSRVMITRFETIATHPIASCEKIYEFIGLEFTTNISMFVYQKTHSQKGGQGYSTDRSNATEACYKWREQIPYKHVQLFDNFCWEPFLKLGYLPVKSAKDLRNMNISLISETKHLS
ncbi:carbohydrate sulfotransferase 1 [Plakobranchus ocellatus]|uniref:Carbohydrate sulfotransferase 1 n=1 Tax=Plakobranchus ocellatus TaxID=259542 RepID=A0AAV3YUJ3_9GAST|nr:carbohydrate sulfotransferase 1 [Plakobranchus ocellatus]